MSESDSDQEIKRAYRKEMSKHHPDKLAAKGLPPEMMEMARRRPRRSSRPGVDPRGARHSLSAPLSAIKMPVVDGNADQLRIH